ncbi:MAG TPA: acyl-CoA dehydrogenase family protein [Acidimicrobiales bacterium]
MKLSFGPEVDQFRREFVSWLEENRPTDEEIAVDPPRSSADIPEWARRWTRRMFDAGWLVPGWPPERGGRNAGPVETLVYLEEMTKARVPRTTNPQGLGIVAPSLFDYGDERQIREYAMPILLGERSACLGMSEPGAGSDLASLSTRAVIDGDELVINGQKVWTSGANYADFCFLFCRTDPNAPKHKGISVVLVDMQREGITVRPLAEIVHPDRPDLNEVFFDDVRVPIDNLVGEVNNGWAMAGGSLAHERGMVWLSSVMGLEENVSRLLGEAPDALARLSPHERGVVVDRIVSSYIDSQAARCLGYRGFAKLVRGGSAPEQALMKAFCTESQRELSLVAAELTGDRAPDLGDSTDRTGRGEGSWLERYFGSFGGTISAGSSEIQRNIIAERVLGLPRA